MPQTEVSHRKTWVTSWAPACPLCWIQSRMRRSLDYGARASTTPAQLPIEALYHVQLDWSIGDPFLILRNDSRISDCCVRWSEWRQGIFRDLIWDLLLAKTMRSTFANLKMRRTTKVICNKRLAHVSSTSQDGHSDRRCFTQLGFGRTASRGCFLLRVICEPYPRRKKASRKRKDGKAEE